MFYIMKDGEIIAITPDQLYRTLVNGTDYIEVLGYVGSNEYASLPVLGCETYDPIPKGNNPLTEVYLPFPED